MNKIILSYPSGYTRIYLEGVLLPLRLAYLLLICLFLFGAEIQTKAGTEVFGKITDDSCKASAGIPVPGNRTVCAVGSDAGIIYQNYKSC